MYLNLLSENEKKSFLALAKYVAENEGLKNEESIILAQYQKEMELDSFEVDISSVQIDDILKTFSSEKSKKIVMLEIFSLIYADEVFSEAEQEMVDKIGSYFEFSNSEVRLCQDWSKAMIALSDQGMQIINL